jgi:hypothetical protein
MTRSMPPRTSVVANVCLREGSSSCRCGSCALASRFSSGRSTTSSSHGQWARRSGGDRCSAAGGAPRAAVRALVATSRRSWASRSECSTASSMSSTTPSMSMSSIASSATRPRRRRYAISMPIGTTGTEPEPSLLNARIGSVMATRPKTCVSSGHPCRCLSRRPLTREPANLIVGSSLPRWKIPFISPTRRDPASA